MKITTAELTLEPETIEEAHHLRDAIDSTLDAIDPPALLRAELKAARDALHHWHEFADPVTLTVAAIDHVHTGLCVLAEWADGDGDFTDLEVEILEQLAHKLEGALRLAGELGALLGRGESKCEGHPAGPNDPLGETKYCDGSCLKSRAA